MASRTVTTQAELDAALAAPLVTGPLADWDDTRAAAKCTLQLCSTPCGCFGTNPSHRWRTGHEQPVSYDGCDPDIDGVLVTIREGDVFKLDLDSAERLVADLDAAIGQARRGAAALLSILAQPTQAEMHWRANDVAPGWRPRLTCGMSGCDHAPHRGPCGHCGCSGVRVRGRVDVADGCGVTPTGVTK